RKKEIATTAFQMHKPKPRGFAMTALKEVFVIKPSVSRATSTGLPSFGSGAREIFCKNMNACTGVSKPTSVAETLLKHNRSHSFGSRSKISRWRNKQNEVSLDLWFFVSRQRTSPSGNERKKLRVAEIASERIADNQRHRKKKRDRHNRFPNAQA